MGRAVLGGAALSIALQAGGKALSGGAQPPPPLLADAVRLELADAMVGTRQRIICSRAESRAAELK
jgi:hypothetical protein